MIPLRDVIPSRTTPGVTLTLIACNVLVYLFGLLLTDQGRENLIIAFGLVPAYFSVVNIFTSMFMHGGLMHIIGNMLYLWIFGRQVETSLGHGRYLVFYLLCGIAAAFAQSVSAPASTVPMIGASGAISGVLGAYLVLCPRANIRVLVFLIFITVIHLPA